MPVETLKEKPKKKSVAEYKKEWKFSNGGYDNSVTKTESLSGIMLKEYKGKETDLVIPEMIGTKPVVGIEVNAFADNPAIVSVVIPESVYGIHDRAFQDCVNLKKVIIKGDNIYIGSGAFEGCSSLSEITIPAKKIRLSIHPFQGCKGLTDENGFVILETGFGKVLGDYQLPISVNEISVPEGIVKIDGYAFAKAFNAGVKTALNDRLKKVVLPESLLEIGQNAFADAIALEQVIIRDGLRSIGQFAFRNCTSLTKIHLPDTIEEIGGAVFYNCKNLTVYGAANSIAEEYAVKNHIPFVEE